MLFTVKQHYVFFASTILLFSYSN